MKCPCKGCKDRSAECHAHCEAYAAYAQNNRERLAAQTEVRRYNDAIRNKFVYTKARGWCIRK